MSENVRSGEIVEIRVFLYDGTAPVTGLSPVLSIERLVDNRFWDGADWQIAYSTVAMVELTPSNVHNDGVYAYVFQTEAAPTERVYDWGSIVLIALSRQLITRGRIRTYNL